MQSLLYREIVYALIPNTKNCDENTDSETTLANFTIREKVVNCVHFVCAGGRFNAKFARMPKDSAKKSQSSV